MSIKEQVLPPWMSMDPTASSIQAIVLVVVRIYWPIFRSDVHSGFRHSLIYYRFIVIALYR